MAEGKVAVCTGSGRPGGLGEAILGRLGKEGYRLVVTDVDGSGSSHLAKPDEVEAVAESLRSQSTEVLSHACDVRSPESVEQLFDAATSLTSSVSIGSKRQTTRQVLFTKMRGARYWSTKNRTANGKLRPTLINPHPMSPGLHRRGSIDVFRFMAKSSTPMIIISRPHQVERLS